MKLKKYIKFMHPMDGRLKFTLIYLDLINVILITEIIIPTGAKK
jgi:hypothetical protein